jgi:sporulation protein YlmC with PRC-barrel domain
MEVNFAKGNMMKKLMLTVASAALGIGMVIPSNAQTLDADCQKLFEQADTNKDGSLGAGESDKFVVLMSAKPKDAGMVTMEEFMAECRKDAFKSIQEAAVTPAPDSNSAAKTSSDTAAESSTSATQPATSTDQAASSTTTSTEQTTTAATVEQPAASTTTATTDPAATAEQPAASTDQAATPEQPAASTDQAATPEQPAASTDQAATAEQPAASTEAPATSGQAATDQATTPAQQPSGDMLASKLIGTTVVSIDNQNIGEINDIVIDVENQEAAQAIIGVGGFLGIGEKNVAVELNRLNVRTDANTNSWTVVLDTTEDELKQMPEYKAAAN